MGDIRIKDIFVKKDIMEQWIKVDMVGIYSYYEVSSYGRVRSLSRQVVRSDGLIMNIKTQYLTPSYSDKGYYKVMLSGPNGYRKNCRVHRLVAIAFHKNLDNKPDINHKNGCKTDNYYQNLEWVTSKENYEHARATGLVDGSNSCLYKAVYQLTGYGGDIIERFDSIEEAARATGSSPKKISDVVNGRRKSTGGYGFIFV